MPSIKVKGGNKLQGSVCVHGSKNAALPILASTVLFDDETIVLDEIPKITDVSLMISVLKQIGMEIAIDDSFTIKVPSRADFMSKLPDALISKMRATILLLGGLLSAKGKVSIALPGGCSIGYRPIDLHISALEAMGAEIMLDHGTLIATAPNGLHAADIHLDTPSVGATENVIMAAVLTEGETVIDNASREPEVIDLIRFLNAAGANIKGAGSSVVKITGVKKLRGVRYEIIADRMEAATFMIAAAVTGGKIAVKHVEPSHMESLISKLREIGVSVEVEDDTIVVEGKDYYDEANEIDIRTAPFPGFHTDMQVLILPLLLKMKTSSVLVENVFDQRFRHVEEYKKIGADIMQLENMLIVQQKTPFISGKVEATDVRAAASLVLMGLSQDITLEIEGMHHLYRGYEMLIEMLNDLGADIELMSLNGYNKIEW